MADQKSENAKTQVPSSSPGWPTTDENPWSSTTSLYALACFPSRVCRGPGAVRPSCHLPSCQSGALLRPSSRPILANSAPTLVLASEAW